jgi:PTH2 family peptidyl-tRNA hydrolase
MSEEIVRRSKQIIVIRKDLKMRRGKEVAQGSHASMGALLNKMSRCIHVVPKSEEYGVARCLNFMSTSAMFDWIENSFTKICVYVNSEQELVDLHFAAVQASLPNCLITDSGATEFHGVPTKTALAIGPAWDDELKPLTGHLPLL